MDLEPDLQLSVDVQRYYERHSLSTRVLNASFTSIQECMSLAGAHHVTLAPSLLRELAQTNAGDDVATAFPSVFDDTTILISPEHAPAFNFLDDEAAYRMAVTRNKQGASEFKMIQVCSA